MSSVQSTLTERGSRYGEFTGHATITQELKHIMCSTVNWDRLDPDQKEALDMIAHKIGRILNGDPDYADSWHDIAGYAALVDNRLTGHMPKADHLRELTAYQTTVDNLTAKVRCAHDSIVFARSAISGLKIKGSLPIFDHWQSAVEHTRLHIENAAKALSEVTQL